MQIEDRYIEGTRLRLRTVRKPGKDLVWKLGQKVRLASGKAAALAHTTLYLDKAERALLSGLPAVTICKTRHVLTLFEGLDVAVDVFTGKLSGLTMAEVALGLDGSLSQPIPTWLGAEVTDVEGFTGYALACVEADALANLLARYNH
jgi:CYTH domain-containing protein